ncbi:hypothetical protein TELCIR_16874 [Teladorsagia circumcincta]|uniref:Polycystin domain-containing protein n=1 Tax=Teladorsagia circumcincta TaxID=45464 RepID=A0A2G9TUL7_TELCI|nr:hypothetical protein TELCIR_16874 [Teladorsagia circumcincta]
MDDIWNFLEVEFMSSLYKSDDPFTVDEAAMVYYNNRLLGRPRIRMLKVRNDSCTVIASFAREITECFSNFNPIVEDRATIPPGTSEAYSNRWIDRGTRALIIDFSLFNANVNLFSIARAAMRTAPVQLKVWKERLQWYVLLPERPRKELHYAK